MLRIQGAVFLMLRIRKTGRAKNMEKQKNDKKKGGRPRKAVKKDQLLGVKCTLIDRTIIQAKARSVNLSVSEYLLTMGKTGKIDRLTRVLPKEILQFTATLNHLAANMNQIAKKRNSNEELNAIERAMLQHGSAEYKRLAQAIKDYLQ